MYSIYSNCFLQHRAACNFKGRLLFFTFKLLCNEIILWFTIILNWVAETLALLSVLETSNPAGIWEWRSHRPRLIGHLARNHCWRQLPVCCPRSFLHRRARQPYHTGSYYLLKKPQGNANKYYRIPQTSRIINIATVWFIFPVDLPKLWRPTVMRMWRGRTQRHGGSRGGRVKTNYSRY